VLYLQGQTIQEKRLYLLDPEEEGTPSQHWNPLTQTDDITSPQFINHITLPVTVSLAPQNKMNLSD